MSPWLQEKLKDIIDAHVKEEVQEILEKRREEFKDEAAIDVIKELMIEYNCSAITVMEVCGVPAEKQQQYLPYLEV